MIWFGDLAFCLKTKLVNSTATDIKRVRIFNTVRMFNGQWCKLSEKTVNFFEFIGLNLLVIDILQVVL